MLFLILALLLFFLLLHPAEKNDDPTAAKTKTELITQSNWKFKSATAGGTDVSSGSFHACQKDNILTFIAAGTGTVDEGPTKCNSGRPSNNFIYLEFCQANETALHISAPLFTGGSNDFTLVSISETELVVSTDYTPPVGLSNISDNYFHSLKSGKIFPHYRHSSPHSKRFWRNADDRTKLVAFIFINVYHF